MQERLLPLQQNIVLQAALNGAESLGLSIYPVGGCIRDMLSGQISGNEMPEDLDCVVIKNDTANDNSAYALARWMADTYDGAFVPLDTEYGIYRVVFHAGAQIQNQVLERRVYLDFSDALGNNLHQDLGRRDLSINAIALHPSTGELIDPHNGQADLKNGLLRMISKENMLDDPLRMLRVFRFGAKLHTQYPQGIQYDAETLAVVKKHLHLIHQVAGERLQDELYKLFSARVSFPALQQMAEVGLLETLLPEMRPMRAIPPNGHHHLGLFEHTMELVRQAERLFDELPPDEQSYFLENFETTTVTRFGLVKMACLFHDLGKPDTKEVKETQTGERFTYYGHDQVSADMTQSICQRLKTGNRIREHLMHLTRWHLYPCQFGQNSPRRSVLRFFRRMGEATPDLLLLALADRHSTLGTDVTEAIVQREHDNLLWLMRSYREEVANMRQPRLLNGHEVMALLNKPAGPYLKEILEALDEAQHLGEITDKDAAKAWVLTQFSAER